MSVPYVHYVIYPSVLLLVRGHSYSCEVVCSRVTFSQQYWFDYEFDAYVIAKQGDITENVVQYEHEWMKPRGFNNCYCSLEAKHTIRVPNNSQGYQNICRIAMTTTKMAQFSGWPLSSLLWKEVKSSVGSVARSSMKRGIQRCLVATVFIRTASESLVCVSAAKLQWLSFNMSDLLCDKDILLTYDTGTDC